MTEVTLSERAVRFRALVLEEYELTEAEAELLEEVARTLSEIDGLRAALDRDGLTVAGSTGQQRVHPAVNEVRQHRMALARLLKAIDLPVPGEELESQTTKDAKAAARARWDLERARRRGSA